MKKKSLALLAAACLVFAEEPVDQSVNTRIRQEAMEHSQVMHTLHMLTDRYGPRLTGSPNYEAAANWVVKQLTEWGFQNAHLEPWDFGHPGWMNEHAYGLMTAPVRDNLTFEVLAWTPSTKGVVRGNAVQVALPQTPTQEQMTAFLQPVWRSLSSRRHAGDELAISSMRQVYHSDSWQHPSSWKISRPQSERAYTRKSSKFLQMLTRLAKADRHEEFLRRKTDNYTRQRPKSVENCGADIKLKTRSQPRGTCLPARSSDGCDLGSFFAGAGALVSRSPLSARSTNCGLKTIPSVLGNDGKR